MTDTPFGRRDIRAIGLALIALALLALALFLKRTTAPVPVATLDRIDSLARAFKAEQRPPGLVVGITDLGGERILHYGVASLRDSTPVDANTRFEIGSVTKLFTGLLLADMAGKGTVGLDDPIDWYLPDSVYSPTYRGRSIELWELATHTSGLPRSPTNIAPPDYADPYAAYTADKLFAFLEGYHLRRAPGAAYDYSNVGAGLLGYLLARRAGTSYAELLRERVLEPLGLDETYVARHDTADDHLAQGYVNGTPVEHWYFGALAGCGAVRSTAADLLRLLRDEIEPADTPMADAIRLTQQVRFHVSDRLALALAWHVSTLADGTPYYWHNGSTGGFRSFIGYSPVTHVGVVVLVNDAVTDHQVTRFGLRIGQLAAAE